MARLSTCKKCGITLQPTEKNMYNGKSYCANCYAILKRDGDAYKDLIDNICKTFKIEQPTGLILKQIKEYKNQLNYSYAAMNYTLWYMTSVLTMSLDLTFGVALIKYHYDEARQYFEQQQRITQSVANTEIKTKVIKKVNRTSSNNNKPLVDITKIIKGSDDNKL